MSEIKIYILAHSKALERPLCYELNINSPGDYRGIVLYCLGMKD